MADFDICATSDKSPSQLIGNFGRAICGCGRVTGNQEITTWTTIRKNGLSRLEDQSRQVIVAVFPIDGANDPRWTEV
jgi:hypothetical protein